MAARPLSPPLFRARSGIIALVMSVRSSQIVSPRPEANKRFEQIAGILQAILALNLAVAAAKLIYGYVSGALAISADGVHSLLDAASNGIGLVAVAVSRRPPDANHPYGHRKYETFAALAVAALLFYACSEIGAAAMERLRAPRLPAITTAGFAVMIVTLAVNMLVVWIERREGRRLQSELLLADAAHTQSDVFASLLVLASMGATLANVIWADVLASAMILLLILRAGVEILKGTLSTLSDERRIDPSEVEAAALAEPGVIEAHNVRSRGPSDDIHLDLHILVDPELRLAEAHGLGHRVQRRLHEHWPGLTDVVVHVEPALESEKARIREGGGLKAEG
jgi:cation diffusion facilitator family transporter